MILYRAMQGFSGGAMTPTVFPVVYTKFRTPQLATIMVLISLILNLSSTLGPTIGGYLTDTFSWHWLFLVNIVPGDVRRGRGVAADRYRQARPVAVAPFRSAGLVLMALFLGCLEYALEEGPRWDWFADNTILAAIVVVERRLRLVLLARADLPPADRRSACLSQPQFRAGLVLHLRGRHRLYGATYLIPLFLAQVRGLQQPADRRDGRRHRARADADVAVLEPTGAQDRLAADAGDRHRAVCVAMYLTAGLTNQTSFVELLVPQVVARHGADVLLSAGQYDRARQRAARHAEELGRALQFDPRSRRRDRPWR